MKAFLDKSLAKEKVLSATLCEVFLDKVVPSSSLSKN